MSRSPALRSQVTYVLPLKCAAAEPDAELATYLHWLADRVDVVVADGSPPEVYSAHGAAWGPVIRQVPVTSRTANGKVAGVLDGVAVARTPYVIVADDDVRYTDRTLRQVVARLGVADAVAPQNYFPAGGPWHARLDTARSLLNRCLGSDFPGTVGLRREALLRTHGYCGAVLFENLELIRTLRAHGFSVLHADDVLVPRRPPTTDHFLGQRVRQAYDSQAQPARRAVELATLPLLLTALVRRSWRGVALEVGAPLVAAEIGRRRAGGTRVFAASAALWAPAWVLERSICAWLAVGAELRGGARYGGARLAAAAHREADLAAPRCPEPDCTCDTVYRPAGAASEANRAA